MSNKIAKAHPFTGSPMLTVPSVFGASPNKPFMWRISVLGERPISIDITGLPQGLELKDNVVLGSTEFVGSCNVRITAQNALGTDKKDVELIIKEDGMLQTPLLGFTTWNAFDSYVNEADVLDTAERLINLGISEYGYAYVNLDSGWQKDYGGKYDAIMPNEKFPDMEGMYEKIHSLGLKGGIYSTPMLRAWGCPEGVAYIPGCTRGEPDIRFAFTNTGIGLDRRENANVRQWCDWKVDYLKYDWTPTEPVNADLMKTELMKAPREIAFCVTVHASEMYSIYWNKNCCSWRNNTDTDDNWDNIADRMNTLDKWYGKTSKGHFYDLDMLAIGAMYRNKGKSRITNDEELFSYTLNAFFPSPIQLSMQLDKLTAFEFDLICNEEVIALNQDALCDYPKLIESASDNSANYRIYRRNTADGGIAIAIFNLSENKLDSKLDLGGTYIVRDLWQKRDIGSLNILPYSVDSHCAVIYKLIHN